MAVVEQVAVILKALAESEEGMGMMDLAYAVNLPRSTTSRLLAQMRTAGLIERNRDTLKHRPGLLIAEAAKRYVPGDTLIDRAEREIAAISREMGHTAGLVQLDGDEVVDVRSCVGSAPLRVVLPPDERGPALGTPTGRALMAWWSDDEIAAHFRPMETWLYEAPPQTLGVLMERIANIRARGWESSIEGGTEGIGSVAVAFMDEKTGEALSIYTIFSLLHVDENERRIMAERLLATAGRLGKVMGPGFKAPSQHRRVPAIQNG